MSEERPLSAAPPPRKTERRHRSKTGAGWFVTDTELIELLGVPPDVAAPLIREMDKKSGQYGFPQKRKEWGDRRYRPAVKQWFEEHYGLKIHAQPLRRAS